LADQKDEKAAQGTPTKGFSRLRELTDDEWKKIMERAQEQEAAHDEWERKAILRAYQRSMVWVSRDGVGQSLAPPLHMITKRRGVPLTLGALQFPSREKSGCTISPERL